MSRITNDLARYRRRVHLAAAPVRTEPHPEPTPERIAHVLECLKHPDARGYVNFAEPAKPAKQAPATE